MFGSLFGALGLILQMLRLAPDIMKAIREIIGFIRLLKKDGQTVEARQLVSRMRAGLEHMKKTGDSAPLQSLAEELAEKRRCAGVGCPTELARE